MTLAHSCGLNAGVMATETRTESGLVKELVDALEEVVGCFDAAYTEGLLERLSDENNRDIGSLYDLITRRLRRTHIL